MVLVWNFKNGVDGFVGLSWLLHFGVLRSLVVVFMPVLLIRDVAVSKCPHRKFRFAIGWALASVFEELFGLNFKVEGLEVGSLGC